MSSNFIQVSAYGGTGGRTQTLVPTASTQLFQFSPAGLPGVTDGGDKIYAERIRVRVTGFLTKIAGATSPTPNWQQLAQAFGKVHVFSPDLQEVVPLGHNTVPLLANHDQFTLNGQKPITRKRGTVFGTTGASVPIEYEFEIPFARDYGVRSTDFCPWLPLLDQGVIEFELRPSNALATFGVGAAGWTMTGNWTAEVVIDWFTDKQSLIHAPVGSRVYQPVTAGPEYILKNVGGAKGYDGVVAGCRLANLSWLSAGLSQAGHDNGFYAAYAPNNGPLFGATNGLNRIDLPWRMQKSINAVSAYVGAFLADQGPVRFRANLSAGATITDNDMANWPYTMDPSLTDGSLGLTLVNDALDFFPLVWADHQPLQKISDMQKVNGDLTFSADFTTPPGGGAPITHLFRTDEVLAFSRVKVLDIMDRMGMTHVDRGGVWRYIVKYGDPKQANVSTQWGMPLKIVTADVPGAL
jgi:hypothetical protein